MCKFAHVKKFKVISLYWKFFFYGSSWIFVRWYRFWYALMQGYTMVTSNSKE